MALTRPWPAVGTVLSASTRNRPAPALAPARRRGPLRLRPPRGRAVSSRRHSRRRPRRPWRTARPCGRSGGSAGARCRRQARRRPALREEHRSRGALAQLRVLPLGHAGDRQDALLDAVDVDLHADRRLRRRFRASRRFRLLPCRLRGRLGAPALAPDRPGPAGPPSSSLSGSRGPGSPFFSTARYSPKFSRGRTTSCRATVSANRSRSTPGTTRYFPPASNTGYIASARPSVTCFVSPVSTSVTKMAL